MDTTQSSGKNLSVAFKLLFVVFAVVLLIIGLQSWLSISNAKQQNEVNEQQELLTLYKDYNDEVAVLERASAALSLSFANRPDIQKLFLAKDREGLLTLLTPVFDTLATDYDIAHLYIHEPNGTVFLRIHNPEKFGDDITYRRTAAAAIQSQKTVSGVEIGPNRLGIRSVSPFFHQGEFIGMVEVGLDYDQSFIESLKTRNGADYGMWVSLEAATPAGLGPTDESPESPSDKLFYYAGADLLSSVSAELYNRVLQNGETEIQFVSSDDQEFAVLVAPILAYGDRIIGVLEISISRTEALADLQGSQLATLSVAGGLALLALILMGISTNVVVLRSLRHLTAVTLRQLEGDLTARVELLPNDEFGQLGHTFNSMTKQLGDLIGSLETRTQHLEIVVNLSEHLIAILDFDQLLAEMVNQIKKSFDYYHVHIYIIDDQRQNLVIAAGVGQTGAEMKARGHHIPLNAPTNLVARAARKGKIISIDNVRKTEDWLPNPLLPDTYSEMAVPIILAGQVVGVLDVQEDKIAGLDEGDANLLRSLANYIAVAIRNARLFAEVESALAEAHTAQERYLEQSWQKTKIISRHGQHLYARPGAAPMDETKQQTIAEARQQALAQTNPAVVDLNPEPVLPVLSAVEGSEAEGSKIQNPKSIVAPINLRNQTIGALQLHAAGGDDDQTWTDDDLTVIETVVNQLAETAENLRLFEETRQRAGREQTIREITERMRATTSLEELVKTATEALGERLSAGHALIELGLDAAGSQSEEGNDYGH